MNIKQQLRPFEQKSRAKASGQLLTTVLPIILLFALQFYSYERQYYGFYLLVLPVLVLFMTRLFIIFHDCGHLNWMKSRKGNVIMGRILGFIFFTPYAVWCHFHNLHHSTSSDLDRRTRLDIQTLTLAEYQALSRGKKLYYRFYRSLIARYFLFVPLIFLIGFRFPHPIFSKAGVASILLNNLLYIPFFWAVSYLYPLTHLVGILLPVYWLFFSFGGFLFFIQHQFEDTYWEKSAAWNFDKAAIQGSSFWDIGPVLHWFTGYIGYHHIHHLNMSIPNYQLAAAHEKVFAKHPEVRRVGFRKSLTLTKYKLWDEEAKRMVGWP